jgi:receptor protein-tyrosine kinase
MSTIEKALDKLGAANSVVAAPSLPESGVAEAVAVESALSDEALTPVSPQPDNAVINQPDTAVINQSDTAAINQTAAQPMATGETPSRNFVEIDLKSLSDRNFVSMATERRLIYEEYRVIKRKLINNAFGGLSSTLKHPNLILVTSSRPGEGKTFTSVNLALSIALEQDKTVLLVDADVLRPNVSRTLEITTSLGLTDYLSSNDVDASDIIYSTNVERLKLITAGKPHHLSTELLASDKMVELVNEFASRYPDRIVIFDAPPLLGVNETAVLAGMCGQAIVVLEENKTKLNELERALSLLPKELAVGFVINKAYYSRDKGYGYGYGYYAD